MDKSTFGIHQIELVIQTSPSFHDRSGVGQAANGTLNLCKVTAWYDRWWLVVYAHLVQWNVILVVYNTLV